MSVGEQFNGSEHDFSIAEPLQLLGQIAKGADYPVEAMGERLHAAVVAISQKAFVPVALAANSALAACSLAVQAHVNVVLPTGQSRPVSLDLVTVATTGERKSTADELAMHPITEYQRELQEQRQRDEPGLLAKRAAWDAAKAEAVSSNKRNGREAIEEALNALGPKPTDPMAPTISIRVGTTQGLIKQFEIARPSLGFMSDEGGSWLGGYGMAEDNRLFTVATLSDLWDGKPIQRLTGGEGMTSLYGRRLTFHMMIQPVLAGRLLGDAEFKGQGFLSRLLVTHPESLAGTRLVDPDAPEDPRIMNDLHNFHDRLAHIIRAPMEMDPETRALNPKALEFTPTARSLWWNFYNDLEKRVGSGGDLEEVRGFVGKLPEHAARIAAVLAVFEHGMKVSVIDTEILGAGIRLSQFYLAESIRLFGVGADDPILINAQAVSDWLRDKWTENLVNVGAIQQRGPSQMRKSSADHVRDVVAALVRNDHLSERLPDGGMVAGKKCREVWRVKVGRHGRPV